MNKRAYNFNPGPAVLPEEVLLEAKDAIFTYKETGVGMLEISHRSKEFEGIVNTAKADILELLGAPAAEWDVLFLQGGASLQFYMVPLNLAKGKVPAYVNSGMWAKKAISEAKRLGKVNVVASSEEKNYTYIPSFDEKLVDPASPYLHFTSNNTIFGTEYKNEPASNQVPLVCDASSDFLSRPVDIKRYGLIYAGAQKNAGPSGVSVVVMRKDWLKLSDPLLPPMLSYAIHAENNSLYNTPSTFSIYVVGLVMKWIKKMGGLEAMAQLNEKRAALLYNFIDQSNGYYRGTCEKESRSLMNITFRLPTEALEEQFAKESQKAGFLGLKGHRSVGGMRASVYNAFPIKGVEDLVVFMKEFQNKNKAS